MLTILISFLLGVATGAGGQYIATKYTDKRREDESLLKLKSTFLETVNQMPELVKEMQDDLNGSENKLIRDFFVLGSKRICFNSDPAHPSFLYYQSEHEYLSNKLVLLESNILFMT